MENTDVIATDFADIIEIFTIEKIKSRHAALVTQINEFIKRRSLYWLSTTELYL